MTDLRRWDKGIKQTKCFLCGASCIGDEDIVLCGSCKRQYDGFILMGCANCGNSKIVLLTESLRPKLEWLKANNFAVEQVHHTYFVMYPFCPSCKKKEVKNV